MTDHVRRILQTIVSVARDEQYQEMTLWLHTLGFRGHVTSKSRQFSTTMKALREHRADWRRERAGSRPEAATVKQLMWEFERLGYENLGDGEDRFSQQVGELALDCINQGGVKFLHLIKQSDGDGAQDS
ncbi:MAG: replication initiator [Mycobacterium sp.]